jgi:lipoprotein-anchoring transpeptidase ErfK/SrfK
LEGDSVVFHTRVSTGNPNTPTPLGEFRVLYKRHARRMTVTDIPSPYDLPGVAFPTYFTWSGVAIHGTYWHNDYGRVHSSGCINVTAEDAQWIFRWVEPVAPYEVYTQRAEPAITGTRVLVV